MSRVYKGVVPPGKGWHYPQPGIPQPVTGGNYDELITNITNARIHNNIPLGQPEKDFEIFFCAANPHLCNPISPEVLPETETHDPSKTFRERVSAWAGNRYSQGGFEYSLEPDETANSRAKICSACPQNKDYDKNCPPCVEQIERTLVLLRQNRDTDPKVECCSITAQANSVACYFPPGKMLNYAKKYKQEIAESAPRCWMLELL